MTESAKPKPTCDPSVSCACGSGTNRRDFLQFVALGAAMAIGRAGRVMAGPFEDSEFERLVPADKKLDAAWVASLTARGEPTVYRGAELARIGMPIGGLCAGQLYLGGTGKLWHWDIFNLTQGTNSAHYAEPMEPQSPLEQGFGIRIHGTEAVRSRPLDQRGWSDIAFQGQYPIGVVRYREPGEPIEVDLEAFSPFVPLDVERSSFPATVMRYTIRNTGKEALQVEVLGWLENAVGLASRRQRVLEPTSLVRREGGCLVIECGVREGHAPEVERPDIVFEDFEKPAYGSWTATGRAFGKGPVARKDVPTYQGDLAMEGDRAVNSHATAPGDSVGERDAATGTLTSPPFVICRRFIRMKVGGGNHAGTTCVNLTIDGKVVCSATGRADNRMSGVTWNVPQWEGRRATIEVVDRQEGSWGNIGLDQIVFSDRPGEASGPLADEPDVGTLAIVLFDALPTDQPDAWPGVNPQGDPAPDGHTPVHVLGRKVAVGPGEETTVSFGITWHFPNLDLGRGLRGRHYATRFENASDVALALSGQLEELTATTRLWRDTWYDSSLPYWFLERTILNASILASSTCHRLADGRFYGWEGVGCCAGTCTHVWQYAHSVAHLFPELERDTRERVDFGLALQPDGAIWFRAEFNDIPAVDGQAGTILRAYREHQMSPDDTWLKRNWPGIKRAMEWLIAKDANDDGLIESNQHNTLDTDWYGPVAWLSGLYRASLMAGVAMAAVVGDAALAARCETCLGGLDRLVSLLYNGEYFINLPDPAHPEAINSGSGCHIDQVMGQGWAFQVGLGRVLPRAETLQALEAIWRYNFTPDVGPYRAVHKPGRWYAMPGEAGLLMCTFPRADWDFEKAQGRGPSGFAGYFNECMNGFEYQTAGHMIWEGQLEHGLAVTRAVHDRYSADRRNPYNEVECGDHYARSMASHGVYLAACGWHNDSPRGQITLAPRLGPDQFRAAYTTAESWGSVSQERAAGRVVVWFEPRHGTLRLKELVLDTGGPDRVARVRVTRDGQVIAAELEVDGRQARVLLAEAQAVPAGGELRIELET